MTAEIRWFWRRLNANYWFYPAVFALTGGILAFLMVWLDRNGLSERLNEVEWLIPARPEGASNMLQVIAAAMIAVASTVFSITIVAVSYASGTYGPRLLTNFMEDKGNQLSLATFIGTFVYALTVLRAVRAENEVAASAADAASTGLPGFVPQGSLLVAYGLMAVSVAVLVFFLNHIPSGIRINNVLKGIGHRLLRDIESEFPKDANGAEGEEAPDGTHILSKKTGYVQIIDFEEVKEAAGKHGCKIALEVRTGDFVHPGVAIARVCSGQASDEVADDVRSAFSFGPSRTPEQDPQFLIDELVEIGLRALSPGINDPFTAITALHWLGAATAELGRRDLRKCVAGEKPGERTVIPLPDDFAHFVDRGFGAMRSAIATSRISALVMLDSLRNAAAPIQYDSRKGLLLKEGGRLIEQVRLALSGPDLEEVEARYVSFQRAFDRHG